MNNAEDTNSLATTISMDDESNSATANSSSSRLRQSSAERLDAALSEKQSLQQESDFSLNWIKWSGSSSSGFTQKTQNNECHPAQNSGQNLRVQLYQPPKLLQAIVEESKVGVALPVQQAVIQEPRVQILCDIEHKAIVEPVEKKVGHVIEGVAAAATMQVPTLLISDDENDGDQSNKDTYESFEDTNETLNCPSLLPAVDSRCCTTCPQRLRENETQTIKSKIIKRDRVRLLISGEKHDAAAVKTPGSNGSSDGVSSEPPARKLVLKTQNQSTFKQRQLDLHRHKILVEQRRLELLELKIARERDEMLRDTILYQKELELKGKQLRKITDDRLDDD